jgi:DNA-binding CsgD family transcriptional regulator
MFKQRKASHPRRGAASRQSRLRPRWTRSEIAILKRLYRTHSNAEIAKVLGRKVSSVVFKAHRLRLSKGIRRLREMGRQNIRRRWKGHNRRSGSDRQKKPSK